MNLTATQYMLSDIVHIHVLSFSAVSPCEQGKKNVSFLSLGVGKQSESHQTKKCIDPMVHFLDKRYCIQILYWLKLVQFTCSTCFPALIWKEILELAEYSAVPSSFVFDAFENCKINLSWVYQQKAPFCGGWYEQANDLTHLSLPCFWKKDFYANILCLVVFP